MTFKRYIGALLPALLCVALFGATVFWLVLPHTEETIMDKKREMIRELSQSVISLLASYEHQEQSGLLTREEAQRRSLERVRSMRYGLDGKNYFWLMDLRSRRMLMHPYALDLVGQDLSDTVDTRGVKIFQSMLQVLDKDGSGYVAYTYQYLDDPRQHVPKIAYVARFPPWGWAVGTGVYMDDLQADMARLTSELTWAGVLVWLVVTLLGAYITLRNIKSDRENLAAQRSLRESAQKFRSISSNALDGIVMIDSRHEITFWNKAAEDIFGYPASEALGQNALELVAVDKRQREFPVELSVSALNLSGQWHVVCVVRNITKRRQAEKALAESEKLYRTMFNQAGDAILLLENGIIIDCNQAAMDLFGGGREQIVGLRPAELSPLRQGDSGDSLVQAQLYLDQALAGLPLFFEWNHRRLDGSSFQAEVSLIKIDLPDKNYLLAMIRDVSQRKQADAALRQSEQRLRQAQSVGGVGSYEIDLDTGTVWGSEQAARIYGLDGLEYLPLEQVQSLTLASDRPRLDLALQELLQRNVPYEQEYTIRRTSDGLARQLVSRAEVLRDEQGRPLKVMGTVQDITERKRVQERISKNEATLAGILKASPSGMAQVSYPQREIVWANERMCQMTGHALPELLGMCTRDLYVDPALFDEVHNHVPRDLLATGAASFESQWRRRDGSLLDVLITVSMLEPGDLSAGQVTSVLDITASKLAQEQMRRSEEKYRLILESTPDPVVLYDMQGKVLYLNPAFSKVFGWTLEEMAGRRVDYVPPEEQAKTREMIGLMMQGKTGGDFETRRYNRQGEILNVAMNWAVWRDDQGRLAGSVVVLRDVTEHKKMVAQLEQARKMEAVGTLAGGIAHDFNNVLQAISGNVQLLMMRRDLDSGTQDTLAGISTLTQRAAEMIQQLLTISRKREVKLQAVSLNQEVRQICRLLERIIPKMIALDLHLAPDLWPINGDQSQLEQIILNLAGNAADAMPQGGTLTFQTQNVEIDEIFCRTHPELRPGPHVLLRAADTGQGMDKETQKHIFEPFFTTKQSGKGTGLGLSTVYGIVTSHLGLVTCYSDPGRGTAFNLYLPALAQPGNSQDKVAALVETEPRGGSETVLLVDDEPDILRVGSEILAMFGYRVLEAGSGEEALTYYQRRAGHIHLVILDLNMPGMGGQRCLESLLRLDPKARVLISSGYYTHLTARDLAQAGAQGFIAKPYRLTDMVRRVREVLDQG